MSRSIWSTLGLRATNDVDAIRKAYAVRVKATNPEDDAEGFQALRAAYDQAITMARQGWAAPAPRQEREDPIDDADFGGDSDDGRWEADTVAWRPPAEWARPKTTAGIRTPRPPAPESDLPDDIRLELKRERDLAEAHQALCDELTTQVVRGDDAQAVLSAMINIFRSRAIDSLTTHGRTEFWLAHLIATGGPVADTLIEPAIQFFGWESDRVGIDLRHAVPVLERRDANLALRRMEKATDPDHAAWQALTRKPGTGRRILQRLTPGLSKKVREMLGRIDYSEPHMGRHLDEGALTLWRQRLSRPGLSALTWWAVIVAPLVLAAILNGNGAFGPPRVPTFAAFWVVGLTTVLAGVVAHLHGVVRPGLRWLRSDPFNQPIWRRFGWAPPALILPVVAPFSEVAPLPAALLVLLAIGLWGWATVTTAHMRMHNARKLDWTRGVGPLPLLFYVLMVGASLQSNGALLVLVPVVLILQVGADSIGDELQHRPRRVRQAVAAVQIGLGAFAMAAVMFSVGNVTAMAFVSGLITALALLDRTIALNRVDAWPIARRYVLLGGWIGGFIFAALLSLNSFMEQAYVGLSAWLLVATGLTAVSGLTDGRPILPERFRRKKAKRPAGNLA